MFSCVQARFRVTQCVSSTRLPSRVNSTQAFIYSNMSQPRFCIVSDLDHTLVDHSDHSFPTLLEFDRLWLSKFAHDSCLVFSTGRSLALYTELRNSAPLLTPDLLICSVGTEIYQDIHDELVLDKEWLNVLDEGWDRDKITSLVSSKFEKLKPQADSEQRPHKVSYHLVEKDEFDAAAYINDVQSAIEQEGLKVKVVYSGGVDVDILPEKASKGLALRFLQERWKANDTLPSQGIQVNGDSGNDAELFEVPGVYGCVVSNAMPELAEWADAHPSDMLFRASERCTAGVMETMRHFGKVPSDDSLPPQARAVQTLVALYKAVSDWQNGSVPQGSDALAEIEQRIVHSNDAIATDESLSFSFLVTNSANTHGCKAEGGPELVWLDCPHLEALQGREGFQVKYQVCRMAVKQKRHAGAAHTIALLPSPGAPEGFMVEVAR